MEIHQHEKPNIWKNTNGPTSYGAIMVSGWEEVVARYGTGIIPQGTIRSGMTVQIGEGMFAPIYKNCTTIGVSDAGLYIGYNGIAGLFGIKPAIIPWNQIRRVDPATLYWQRAARLSIGDPEITPLVLPWDSYRIIADHLSPAHRLPE
jgi:hypothetical protein